jgi:hypothetical protein
MAAVSASTVSVCSVVDMLRITCIFLEEQNRVFGTKTRVDTLRERLNIYERPVNKPDVHRNISIRKYGELSMRGVVGLPITEGLLT